MHHYGKVLQCLYEENDLNRVWSLCFFQRQGSPKIAKVHLRVSVHHNTPETELLADLRGLLHVCTCRRGEGPSNDLEGGWTNLLLVNKQNASKSFSLE